MPHRKYYNLEIYEREKAAKRGTKMTANVKKAMVGGEVCLGRGGVPIACVLEARFPVCLACSMMKRSIRLCWR